MLVSKAKFLQYQAMFYKKLLATPYKIQLERVRESTFYEFRALYEKEIPERTREKYGLPKEVNGVVYLSPKQLVPKLGDYHLDWNRTKVHFEGRTQVIDRIIYLEDFKEYGSCIGLQIFVKDDLKGG